MFIFPHGTWKDNIRSVIWDWRQRSADHTSEGERAARLSSEGRDLLVTQADLSAPSVFSPAIAQLHKKGPRNRRKICANSLWLYFYSTQASLSKNKNMNYTFIYLRVFRCLSSGAICNNIILKCLLRIIIWNYNNLLGIKSIRKNSPEVILKFSKQGDSFEIALWQESQKEKDKIWKEFGKIL